MFVETQTRCRIVCGKVDAVVVINKAESPIVGRVVIKSYTKAT